jgi:hypothetical protein
MTSKSRVGIIHEAAVLWGGTLPIKKRRIEREETSRLCVSRHRQDITPTLDFEDISNFLCSQIIPPVSP